jgi:hypothetical protein
MRGRRVIFGLGLALAIVVPALAHDHWINEGGYRSHAGELCCGEGDCTEIPAAYVTRGSGGYTVALDQRLEFIPYAEVLPSPGGFWRCHRYDGSRRCFFAPPVGS